MLTTSRCCIFAHYDQDDMVDPYVLKYLDSLSPFVQKIIFVSTSDLGKSDLQILRDRNIEVLCRSNIGHDFCSWKLAIEHADLEEFDELLQVNDSCYAPIFDFELLFSTMDAVECDFWGISTCYKFRAHVQSFFVCYRKKVIQSQVFNNFWADLVPIERKDKLVLVCEVGLSQLLLQSEMRMAAYFHLSVVGYIRTLPGNVLRKIRVTRNLNPYKYLKALLLSNPTFYHYKELLHAQVPLIKVGLIKDTLINIKPLNLTSISTIDQDTLRLIRRHQLRIAPDSHIDAWIPPEPNTGSTK